MSRGKCARTTLANCVLTVRNQCPSPMKTGKPAVAFTRTFIARCIRASAPIVSLATCFFVQFRRSGNDYLRRDGDNGFDSGKGGRKRRISTGLDFYTMKRLIVKGALVLETFRFGRGSGKFHSLKIAWVTRALQGPLAQL